MLTHFQIRRKMFPFRPELYDIPPKFDLPGPDALGSPEQRRLKVDCPELTGQHSPSTQRVRCSAREWSPTGSNLLRRSGYECGVTDVGAQVELAVVRAIPLSHPKKSDATDGSGISGDRFVPQCARLPPGWALMRCVDCNKDKPNDEFSWKSQKNWHRGKTKGSRCIECQKLATKRFRQHAIPKCQRRLERATSPKKIAKLKKRLQQLEYSILIKPRARSAKRRAFKLQARPQWVDATWFHPIYLEAAKLSKATGIKHHVDHIIPLQHPRVCGLDVPWNLQILTAAANLSKSNYFPHPEQEIYSPWAGLFEKGL